MAKTTDLGAVTAYALAVKNGFDGTEEEWLTSLKGVKGDTGESGETPVRGVDYWTAQDKQEIVRDVLENLPTWNGGAY